MVDWRDRREAWRVCGGLDWGGVREEAYMERAEACGVGRKASLETDCERSAAAS